MRKLSLVIFCLLFVVGIIWLFLQNNIHMVIPDKIYRSAQLGSGELSYLIKKQGIRSVINLRGKQHHTAWYDAEIATSQRLGIHHYDIPMSAYSVTTKANLEKLAELLRDAPQPILFHCQGGADRTGLAATVALVLLNNTPLSEAEKQISLRYLVIHSNSTGKLTLPRYQAWLKQQGLSSSKANFLKWITIPVGN